ncbi:MAG: S-layer homology domain-containing protein, partial [Oscillospiraceae bacterium]|nr:S-layer homology domain-containing protein [Oscillospiraceae bacterium]
MKHKFRRFTALMLAFIMSFSVLLVPAAAFSFEDVPSGAWYAQAVNYVYEKGWMRGVSDREFAPQQELTRGMFVVVLARIAGAETDNKTAAFTDTPAGRWYTGAAAWAAGEGVVNGVGDGKFAPNRSISRQDLCTMVYRYLHGRGLDAKLPGGQNTSFIDAGDISDYAKDAVEICASVGLVAGFSERDGSLSFRPGATATRAQTAMILMRLDRLLNGEAVNPEPMPAQSFSEDCGEGLRVSVNAPEGALPKGTELQVTALTDEQTVSEFSSILNGQVLAAADISFRKDGAELEPNSEVEVQIAVNGMEAAKHPRVYHVREDGDLELVSAELVSATRAVGSSSLRFYAKDFSVYIVTDGSAAMKKLTVKFYDANDQLHSTQIVGNDKLTAAQEGDRFVFDPGVPNLGGKSFEGWHKDGAGDATTIAEINSYIYTQYHSGLSNNVELSYYPQTRNLTYIRYFDQEGSLLTVEAVYFDSPSSPAQAVAITRAYLPAVAN